MTKRSNRKFDLGKIEITTYAKITLQRSGEKTEKYLRLHESGNHGEVTEAEVRRNNTVIANDNIRNRMILSAYSTSFNAEMIWVVTDLTQEVTWVLRPDEYDTVFRTESGDQ